MAQAQLQTKIGLSAMEIDRDFTQVPVYRYRVTIVSGIDEAGSQVQLTRKVARFASGQNGWQPVTDVGHFLIASLQPLATLSIDTFGLGFTLELEAESVLEAAIDNERSAIERLLNQDLYSAAFKLAQSRNAPGGQTLKASRYLSGWAELEETQPYGSYCRKGRLPGPVQNPTPYAGGAARWASDSRAFYTS